MARTRTTNGSRSKSGLAALVGLLFAGNAQAQPLPERFLHLLQAPGVTGHEEAVRAAVRAQLPSWARPEEDGLGNLVVTLGSGAPHVALVASLDERGYVVSRITDGGYLRLHRPSPPPANPLSDQYRLGQPVLVGTASGRSVPGVTATPSTHLARLERPEEVERIKGVGDLWVDVGASSPAEVERLGIRMLDPVTVRERATPLAAGRIAGVEAQARAGAQALVEILRSYPSPPAVRGTLTIAWVAQSQLGRRGLARLAARVHPERTYLVGRDAKGATVQPPPGWEGVAIEPRAVPVLYPETPVEVVDTRDVAALADELRQVTGLPRPATPGETATQREDGVAVAGAGTRHDAAPRDSLQGSSAGSGSGRSVGGAWRPGSGGAASQAQPARETLRSLLESYGVSGHEGPVRDEVLRRLPAWAKPQVDERGNVTVSFGRGGKDLLFVAHLDEVGFEIAEIRADGRAALRSRGGMFLSLYEAHPVLVQTAKGPIPAILTPREKYAEAKTSQPALESLALDFGTASASETQALGAAVGDAVTVRKELAELGSFRAAGRSMDDRVGSTALLLALRRLDPGAVKNRVTFAWSVGEEVGLDGARFLATRLHPDVAFAVDTFVSTDAPLDLPYLAHAELGKGPVLRGLDNATVVPAEVMTRLQRLAREAGVPLQIGVTQGGTDASAFSAGGAVDIGLSWPGRYSHSPVEVMDLRDLDGLARLLAALARRY